MQLLASWKEIIDTANLSPQRRMDVVSRWLLITRAAVFSMTAISGLIGGLLAAAAGGAFDLLNFGLAWLGLIVAHACNNMINDYFDLESGIDTSDYARAQYAPHPVLGGLITKSGLRRAILTANLLDAAILLVLFLRSSWPVLAFAGLGLFISVFYVAPPIRLKHRGLGEPGVFLVWGPLMIGGTYFVTTGAFPGAGVWLACVPYALVVTTVLMGKHIDKRLADGALGVRTIPVLIGDRAARLLNVLLMVGFYLVVAALAATGVLGPWVLLVALALPRLRRVLKIYREPRPEAPPENYPVWPLWYVAAAFYHNKLAGLMFVLGLALNLIVPQVFGG
jgi:1,4-dihydroxy-2-naphthoate octaprenyltransferase